MSLGGVVAPRWEEACNGAGNWLIPRHITLF
jgi:hypothetical protein